MIIVESRLELVKVAKKNYAPYIIVLYKLVSYIDYEVMYSYPK